MGSIGPGITGYGSGAGAGVAGGHIVPGGVVMGVGVSPINESREPKK